MNKIEEFREKAAHFDELAAQARKAEFRASYAAVARSYRELARHLEFVTQRSGPPAQLH
jgi:hypothetical protein